MNTERLINAAMLCLAVLANLNSSAQITDTGNKVGIGIPNPQEKLSLPWNTEIGFAFQSGAAAQMRIKGALDGLYFTSAWTSTGTDRAFSFITYNNTRRVTILMNGNVGIGVAVPNAPLAVKGLIRAGQIEVVDVSGWSDFVFKPEYQLRPLENVELFIKAYGHLPDVPSEAQVKKEGVNLQKMDAILLQKIEELTLYIIEQKKTIETLKSQVESMTKDETK